MRAETAGVEAAAVGQRREGPPSMHTAAIRTCAASGWRDLGTGRWRTDARGLACPAGCAGRIRRSQGDGQPGRDPRGHAVQWCGDGAGGPRCPRRPPANRRAAGWRRCRFRRAARGRGQQGRAVSATVNPTELCPMAAANSAAAGPVARSGQVGTWPARPGEGWLGRRRACGARRAYQTWRPRGTWRGCWAVDPAACCGARDVALGSTKRRRWRTGGAASMGAPAPGRTVALDGADDRLEDDARAAWAGGRAEAEVRRLPWRPGDPARPAVGAASDLRAYLPTAMAARLALPVPGLAAASPTWCHSARFLAPHVRADLADLPNSHNPRSSARNSQQIGADGSTPGSRRRLRRCRASARAPGGRAARGASQGTGVGRTW